MIIDLPLMKPCWVSGMMLCSKKNESILSYINLSRILHRMEVRLIGLKLFGSCLSPFLCIGDTSALFHDFGSIPEVKDTEKILDMGRLRD